MVFLNWKELPWFWYGFDHFGFALLMVVLVPGLLALVFGWFAFRSRVTGVYLSIITQALTYALMLAFFRNDMGFGGNNGLTDFKDILGFDLPGRRDARRALSGISAIALGSAICLSPAIIASRLGKVLMAVRDAESRDAVPRLPRRVRTSCASSCSRRCMAGIAGALYVPQVGIINPSEFAPINSIEVGDLGRGRRARHAVRARSLGAVSGQLRQDLVHRRAARGLAVRARRACSCS